MCKRNAFVTVLATFFVMGWTWSRSTAMFFQPLVFLRSQSCILEGEQLLTTSSTTPDATWLLIKEVGGVMRCRAQRPGFGCLDSSFCTFAFSRCWGCFGRRFEADWLSFPPVGRCLAIDERTSQPHNAL